MNVKIGAIPFINKNSYLQYFNLLGSAWELKNKQDFYGEKKYSTWDSI